MERGAHFPFQPQHISFPKQYQGTHLPSAVTEEAYQELSTILGGVGNCMHLTLVNVLLLVA